MELPRRRLLAVASGALTLPLSGCVEGGLGGDDGENGAGMDTTTETDTTQADTTEADTTETDETTSEASEEGGPTLAVETVDAYSDIVVGPDGSTVYMFEPDPADASGSACTGDCADAWPPLTVEDPASISVGDNITGSVETFQREDGSLQVALGGWPLYSFQGDAEPGDISGQGVNQAWWVLAPNGRPREPAVQVREHPDLGPILTDEDGMTLYMFEMDAQGSGKSVCTDGCAEAWPPLTVDAGRELLAGGGVTAEVGTITRPSGSRQVTVAGWPVYGFQNDEEVGDTAGHGVTESWWVLAPDGSPIRPDSAMETTTTENGTGESTNETNTTTSTTTTTTATTTEDPGGGGDY